jgi:hypothetical protein
MARPTQFDFSTILIPSGVPLGRNMRMEKGANGWGVIESQFFYPNLPSRLPLNDSTHK